MVPGPIIDNMNINPHTSPKVHYELEIVQQPIRARMCGLGDKDRRQITPPPFIKVLPYDLYTKQAVDVDSVDISQLILVVELWSTDGKEDLTLNQNIVEFTPSDTQSSTTGVSDDSRPSNQQPSSDSDDSMGDVPTRNLIGSTVLNAYKLLSDTHELGIWFILSDLSVRIEGDFKLMFKLVNLSTNETTHKFSHEFKVFSAKKFPGVVDSIPLGRVFASQGVKIPIRRETRE
jgi:hypothetical protein